MGRNPLTKQILMQKIENKIWKNHIGEQKCRPKFTFNPSEIDQIRAIITSAEERNKRVRACGSGHSWSNVCHTEGYLILPDNLSGELPLEGNLLKPETTSSRLLRVKSGTSIKTINQLLDLRGLAIGWLGGYDGQRIAGVNATSTHGSVFSKGPLYEMILSYDIIGSGGLIYRIEKSNGITDKSKYSESYPDRILIQNDQYYNAVSVNIGCLGVIYSVIIEATEAFWMKETRELSSWKIEKEKLKNRSELNDTFHFELLLNPYSIKGKTQSCLVTKRIPYNPIGNEKQKDRRRNWTVEFLSRLNGKGWFNWVIHMFRRDAADMIESILKGMEDNAFIHKSFHVFHIGAANNIPSYSAEIALPMTDNKYIDAIDVMLKTIEDNRKKHKLYNTAPIALRFVKSTKAFLSPMEGDDTCMVEVILAKGTKKYEEIYKSLEKALLPFGGRMHWGQYHYISSSTVESGYPKLGKWKEVAQVLNSSGVFNNKFSDSLGLSV